MSSLMFYVLPSGPNGTVFSPSGPIGTAVLTAQLCQVRVVLPRLPVVMVWTIDSGTCGDPSSLPAFETKERVALVVFLFRAIVPMFEEQYVSSHIALWPGPAGLKTLTAFVSFHCSCTLKLSFAIFRLLRTFNRNLVVPKDTASPEALQLEASFPIMCHIFAARW